jgi:hypothetical protein
MMRRIIISVVMLLGLLGTAGLQTAFAATNPDLFHGDGNSTLCTGEAADSAVCKDKTNKNPLTGPEGLLADITTIIAYIAGAAAIIVIIIGGIRFITSNGDSNKVATARSTILNAAIGLVVIVLARTLIIFVLNKL